ncbi:hypothetical protein [Gottfriedia acidiceleris]|uniref:hypothetical protein n=1 Tax=Gottfriedia acidiceleris TaxID=371036 RepID=UPI002FFE65AC
MPKIAEKIISINNNDRIAQVQLIHLHSLLISLLDSDTNITPIPEGFKLENPRYRFKIRIWTIGNQNLFHRAYNYIEQDDKTGLLYRKQNKSIYLYPRDNNATNKHGLYTKEYVSRFVEAAKEMFPLNREVFAYDKYTGEPLYFQS